MTGAYITVGYRVGEFTPYVTYQAQETGDKNRDIGVNSDFNAFSLGARYDFSKVAVKAEVTNFEFGKNGARGYRNTLDIMIPPNPIKEASLRITKISNKTVNTIK